MKTLRITVKGTAPLLVHRFSDDDSVHKSSRRADIKRAIPRDVALSCAYVLEDGSHCLSGFSFIRAMAMAGANHRLTGSRRSLKFVVPTAVRASSEVIVLHDEKGVPLKDCEVDARPVSIPATKGRIMRYRPRYEVWFASFEIVLNDDILAVDTTHTLLNEAGTSVGVGDFRPACSGPFGTFVVVSFKEL